MHTDDIVPSGRKVILGVAAAIGLAIGSLAYYFHVIQTRSALTEIRHQLTLIAGLKVREIAHWRDSYLRHAEGVRNDVYAMQRARRVAAGEASAAERAEFGTWMNVLCRRTRCASAALVRPSGEVALVAGQPLWSAQRSTLLAAEVLRNGDITFHDFDRESPNYPVFLSLGIPISAGEAPQAGVLLLGIDPNEYLYPLVQLWPTPSRTAETLLVRADGDEVVYLNELRHQPGAALKLRVPLSRSAIAAVRGLQGERGVLEAIDYRSVPVLAAVQPIPGTRWLMVAKMDLAEVYAPIRESSMWLGALTGSLLLALGGITAFLWRRQQSKFYQERYQAELKYRALRGHLDYLSRYANDIVLLTDESGKILEANDRAVSAYGYSAEELTQKNLRDLCHPQELSRFDGIRRMIEERTSLIFETVHQRRDGGAIPVEVSARIILVDGKPFQQSIIRDISERKAIARKLQQTLETMQAVIEASPAGIVTLTPEGEVILWSKAAERIFGWSGEEVTGKPLPVIPPEKEEEFRWMRRRILEGETLSGIEIETQKKDGTPITVLLSAAPLRNQEGKAEGITSVFMDATEQRALEREKRLFADTLAASLNEIYMFDAETLKFQYVNRGALNNLGYTLDEMRNMTPLDIKPEFSPEAFMALLEPLRTGEESVCVFESHHRRKDGSLYPVEVHLQLFEQGRDRVFLAVIQDITERKRMQQERNKLEEQLLQAQKMESVGRLAGGVAHDFNNHLTVINGYCELLLRQLSPDDPLRTFLEDIRSAGEKAADLTRQLLAFSRKQIIEPRPVNLNDVVRETERMLRRLIGEDIEIVTALDASLGAVMADPTQLHQVLMNLAVNARDAMPSGGRLILETLNVQLDQSYSRTHPEVKPGQYALLSVTDTGVGMSEEAKLHIFEPFYTTKPKGTGTGLGLSTVYGIVRQMGGWIWVYSEEGKGTTFKIYFPLEDARCVAPQTRFGEAKVARGTETVLVVEDQPEVRKLVVEVLQGYGYRTLEAASGAEGLTASETYSGPIHLLVTDVVMPGMTGRDLAESLAKTRPEMKVLYTSGYTANVIAHQGVIKPGVAYLPKPFTPVQLAAKVREVLGEPDYAQTVLVVDRDAGARGLIQHFLRQAGYHVLEADCGEAGLRAIKEHDVRVVVLAAATPRGGDIEAVRVMMGLQPGLKVALLASMAGPELREALQRCGAHGVLQKPVDPGSLLRLVQRLVSR